jgi:tRNA threonylcarbamoyl adenosine modification protein (Sua5/YciO/YrdC/YwlC family)
MSQYIVIHPENPQGRLLRQATTVIRNGGVIVYPTDSGYALGCQLGNKKAMERIKAIRQLDDKHYFTLVCRDLSELSAYAQIDNPTYRILKLYTPGAYTFLLRATKEVPKRLQHPKRKTIGIRVPDHPIAMALLEALREPLISTTLILPDHETPLIEPEAIHDLLAHQVDLIISGGYCGMEQTTVIDLTDANPQVVRMGKGDATPFL